jgi:Protein of unknown function with HXXEE motif
MSTLRRHWYNIGLVVALLTAIYIAMDWNQSDIVRNLLLLNFVALLLHQFEEYGWPGGEPAIMNMVLQRSSAPDRFPLNQNSAMVVKILAACGFCLLPAFFPSIVWLGIAPTLFGFGQFVVHGIVTYKKLRSFYNPGLAAVVFLHFPIGGYYIYYISSHDLATTWDWVLGVAYTVVFAYVALIKMTYSWLADPKSRFVFSPVEMKRFGVQSKIAWLDDRRS